MVFGSNAPRLTGVACWVAVTRGLNECSVAGHSSGTGSSATGLRKCAGVLDDELEPDPLGQPPDEVPVRLVVLLHEVVGIAAIVAFGGETRMPASLETMSLEVMFWNVCALRERNRA